MKGKKSRFLMKKGAKFSFGSSFRVSSTWFFYWASILFNYNISNYIHLVNTNFLNFLAMCRFDRLFKISCTILSILHFWQFWVNLHAFTTFLKNLTFDISFERQIVAILIDSLNFCGHLLKLFNNSQRMSSKKLIHVST